jgi:hypothetical protein
MIPSNVVHHKLACLMQFNKSVRLLLPFIDLASVHVQGRLGWSLSQSRRVILRDVKMELLTLVLDQTATFRPGGGGDQHEHIRFPLHINRMGNQSIVDQARRQFARLRTPSWLRTPFTPPKGVKPVVPFDVHLKGETVVGQDGPFRAFFADVCREVLGVSVSDTQPSSAEGEQKTPTSAGGAEAGALFVRCPNGVHGTGLNREMYVLRPSRQTEEHLARLRFLGQFMGVALRSSVLLSLDLPALFWRSFVGETATLADLSEVDETTANLIRTLRSVSCRPRHFYCAVLCVVGSPGLSMRPSHRSTPRQTSRRRVWTGDCSSRHLSPTARASSSCTTAPTHP